MQTYAEVLTIAIPFFIVLLMIEYGVSRLKNVEVIRSFDAISSISSGLTNTIKDVPWAGCGNYQLFVDGKSLGSY